MTNVRRLQGKTNLSDWTLDSIDGIKDVLNEALDSHATRIAAEAVDLALDDSYGCFAVVWNDKSNRGDGFESRGTRPREVNPLDVYLELTFQVGTAKEPVLVIDVVSDLRERIAECKKDGSYDHGLKRLMVAMREMADEISDALPKE